MSTRETNLLAFSLLCTYEVIMGSLCSSCCPSSRSVTTPPRKSNDAKNPTPPPDPPPNKSDSTTPHDPPPPPPPPNKPDSPTPHDPPPPSDTTSPQCQTAQEQKLVEDSQLDELISIVINNLQKVKLTFRNKKKFEQVQIPLLSRGTSKVTSTDISDLKEIVEEGTSFANSLNKYLKKPGKDNDITHAVIPILETIGSYHWVSATLFIVGKALERLEAISENREECLNLLEEMACLSFLLKQMHDRRMSPQITDAQIKNAVGMVLQGYFLCCNQMKSSKIRRFLCADFDKKQLDQLRYEIDSTHRKLSNCMSICIYDAIFCINKPPLRSGNVIYPKYAIGIDHHVKEVIKRLDFENSHNAGAVILHNMGGMGKTTLGDAVFSCLDIKNCKYSMVKLFDTINDTPDIIKLQRIIISDLSDKDASFIRTYQEGQHEIETLLKEQNAFIYIDNVVDSKESNAMRNLLPRNLNGAKKLRLLLTTRDINVVLTSLSECNKDIYTVEELADEHVSCILEKAIADELLPVQKEKLIKICKGVPLLVDLVASFIGSYENVNEAYDIVMSNYEKMQTPRGVDLAEVFAIDSLKEEIRESFLDICFYFVHDAWVEVEHIFGSDVMNVLQSRGLVRQKRRYSGDTGRGSSSSKTVFIHDVLLDIARKKAGDNRLLLSSFDEVAQLVNGEMNALCVKGMRLSAKKEDLQKKSPRVFDAKTIDALYGSIRILDICDPFILLPEGFKGMKKLIYLLAEPRIGFKGCLDFSKMPNLKVCHVNAYGHQYSPYLLSQMPRSLQFLSINGAPYGEIHGGDFSKLENLRGIEMGLSDDLRKLPASMGQLSKLKYLHLDGCDGLEELTESLCTVTSLQVLELKDCKKLMKLPDCIGHLPCLEGLVLDNAQSLESLPDNFGNLQSLLHLHLRSCIRLRKLPKTVMCPLLTSLEFVNCTSLEALPTTITHLVSLRRLVLSSLKNIKRLPDDLGKLCNLEYLEISNSNIRELPESFSDLRSLRELKIESCDIIALPDGFGGLSCLETLEIRSCAKLKRLCSDFSSLTSLRHLYINGCSMLERRCMDQIKKLPSVQELSITWK